VIALTFWQKCFWVGAGLLILVSLFSLTRTAETSSPSASVRPSGQSEYYSFQDTSRAETHYAVRDGDRTVIYNSMPASR
jgi:hypothetical protein